MTTIDPSWIELQTGLYLEEQTRVVAGAERTFRYLHSSDGYCFYDLSDEYYDEEGNRIAEEDLLPNQRVYYRLMYLSLAYSSWTIEQLNAQFVSVPVDPSYEIVSTTPEQEVM